MSVFIPSNYTFEEAMKVMDIPKEVEKYFNELIDKINLLEKELTSERRSYEIVSEQEDFAKQLLGEIIYEVRTKTKAIEIKKAIEILINNSSVEF